MKCPQCGVELDDAARFCGSCGARMGAVAKPAAKPQASAMKTIMAGSGLAPVAPPPKAPAPAAPVVARPAPRPVMPVPPTQPDPQRPIRPRPMTPAPGRLPSISPQPQSQGIEVSPTMIPAKPSPPAMVHRPPSAAPAPSPFAPPAAGGDPFVGKTLNNRYLIEAKLGEGGFGAVYKGKQLQIGREVALKVLHPEMARDPNLVARFRREGAVACNLRDAHTITTYDFDQTPEGVLYIAMELLTGRSLHDVFQAEAPLPWARVLRVLEQMCTSLGEAHAQGIVHRDIKPENIYLENRPGNPDFVKVLDFGIAKIVGGEIGQQSPQLTATGQTLGTLEYMSPEQLMGKQLDGRSDIYALGVLGYELLTGRLPFPDAQGPAALIAAQLRKTPDAPSVARPDAGIPATVDKVILMMLEKDRAKRYADSGALQTACLEAISADAQRVRPSSQPVAIPHTVLGQTPASLPDVAREGRGPDTDQLGAVVGNKMWLWIAIGVVVVGGAIGAFLALR